MTGIAVTLLYRNRKEEGGTGKAGYRNSLPDTGV